MMHRKLLLASAALLVPAAALAAPADLVAFNGKVLVVDEAFTVKSAIAVKDGKVIAIGGPEIAETYQAPLRIDLAGRTLMPGFMDTHLHLFGVSPRSVPVADARSIAEIKAMVRQKARELGPGEWITGIGWDEYLLSDKRRPTRYDLDEAAPDNPVALSREGGHSIVGNSMAIRIAGITRDTPDPTNGVIEHDEKGEPNGTVRERADLYTKFVPPAKPGELRASYVAALKELTRVGITSMVVAGAPLDKDTRRGDSMTWPEWQSLYAENRTDYPRASVQITYPGYDELKAFGFKTGDGDDRLRLGAIGEGGIVDGGFTGPTACTFEDYKGQAGFKGRCFFNQAGMDKYAEEVASLGWQLGLHMIGDRGIAMAMDSYAKALDKYPGNGDRRWFASHFTMLPPEKTLDLMARYGIYAAAQPNFTYSLGARYDETLDGARLEHINPVATPLAKGVKVVFGADYPLTRNPRAGLYSAVTRKSKQGRQYAMAEAVPIREAIRLYTAAPAYLTWEEKTKGTLEVGKLADMIVLDRDPLTAPAEDLLKMNVDLTIIGGKVVYDRAKDGPSKYAATN